MNKKLCAFIDLLGFSNFIQEDTSDALKTIENYNNILSMNFTLENNINSFEEFLPCSDSIFIVGNNTNQFIKEISNFLLECFLFTAEAYTNPIDSQNPTIVIEREIDFDLKKNKAVTNNIERKWFPTIFKGGLSYDEVVSFKQKKINDNSLRSQANIAGKGVLKAVALEKTGRGPRLFCDNFVIERMDEATRKKYIYGQNNITEILWPISCFTEENTPEIELQNNFSKLFEPSFSLWKSYSSTMAGEVYFNLLRLIIISTIRFFLLKDYHEECITYIKNELKQKKIDYYFDSLTSF